MFRSWLVNEIMRNIDVCLSPELIDLYDIEGKIVVVVDILRATSCMVTATAHGIKEIVPVCEVEECKQLQQKGYLAAAERNGDVVEGFEFGNSPFSYMDENIKGKSLGVTTTNGTIAINRSRPADEVLIGAFLNISAIAEYVKGKDKDLVIFCAGWKGRVNLEDTLFAGALIDLLKETHSLEHDAAIVAHSTYLNAQEDMLTFLSGCSHVRRLNRLNIKKDIEFCLRTDVYDVIPALKGDSIIPVQ